MSDSNPGASISRATALCLATDRGIASSQVSPQSWLVPERSKMRRGLTIVLVLVPVNPSGSTGDSFA